jgi:nicotinamidase-related amidase
VYATRVKRLDPKSSVVLVVDVQERLAAAMPPESMTALGRAANVLLEAASALGVRVIATEQYPQGLGPTLPAIRERLSGMGAPILEKMEFAAVEAPGFASAWEAAKGRTAIVIGMETHVCVFQTVRELAQRGVEVHVPIDGVASRRDDHRQVGIDLCRAAGATVTTAETVVFDWLARAGGDAFKRISKAVK